MWRSKMTAWSRGLKAGTSSTLAINLLEVQAIHHLDTATNLIWLLFLTTSSLNLRCYLPMWTGRRAAGLGVAAPPARSDCHGWTRSRAAHGWTRNTAGHGWRGLPFTPHIPQIHRGKKGRFEGGLTTCKYLAAVADLGFLSYNSVDNHFPVHSSQILQPNSNIAQCIISILRNRPIHSNSNCIHLQAATIELNEEKI
jgi:hypothetical protein